MASLNFRNDFTIFNFGPVHILPVEKSFSPETSECVAKFVCEMLVN